MVYSISSSLPYFIISIWFGKSSSIGTFNGILKWFIKAQNSCQAIESEFLEDKPGILSIAPSKIEYFLSGIIKSISGSIIKPNPLQLGHIP